jgi:hypothetical protein
VWKIDIKPEMRHEFRKKFADLSRFNKFLTKGSRFVGVYETVIGKRDEPPFQIWFEFPDLRAYEELAFREGIRKFHEEIEKYLDPNFRPFNEFLRKL